MTAGAITGYLLFVLLNVLAGVALGALLHNSATAIAASFALPAAFALLGAASKVVAEWIDMSTTFNWVLENEWEVTCRRSRFRSSSGWRSRWPSASSGPCVATPRIRLDQDPA